MALLTDLYISPSGPNVRAALAHGSWDAVLERELVTNYQHSSNLRQSCNTVESKLVDKTNKDTDERRLWDFVRILLVVYDALGEKGKPSAKSFTPLQKYRPTYSFTAVTCHYLEDASHELKRLYDWNQNYPQYESVLVAAKSSLTIPDNLSTLFLPWSVLEEKSLHVLYLCRHNQPIGINDSCWSSHDVLREHTTNQQLAACGAVRSLLEDCGNACSDYVQTLEETLQMHGQNGDNLSTRQRRQKLRIVAAKDIAITMYGFAAFTGLLLLEESLMGDEKGQASRDLLLKAVERSRMMVSTVSTYLVANTDRSIKSASEFAKGKAVKVLLQNHTSSL